MHMEYDKKQLLLAEYFNIVLPDEVHQEFNILHRSSLHRSHLHNQIAEVFDIDREFVEELIEKVRIENYRPEPLGIDYSNAFREFCDGIEEISKLPAEKRHRVSLFSDEDFSGLDEIPSLQ